MRVRCGGCFKLYDEEFGICPECGHYDGKPAKEPYQLVPGTMLANRYLIGNVLGFGGFGITYKAWDKKLESVVCIKEYYPSGIVNRIPGTSNLILFSGAKKKEFEYGLVRFIDEARNMTKFNSHKNIVNVYEYFEENNTAYIVMEFLDGCTLSEFMEDNPDGKIPLDKSIEIIKSVGNALKDVHESGIIHRDVSPDNVFLCKDHNIKLIDFGAARFSAEEAKNFTIILKPGFAPPEQYEQISDQGPKTDIYALGATLYYMVTGVKPDESTNRKIKDIVEEPNTITPEIPQHINDTIMKAMAIEPHLRFESVEEFEKSLNAEIKVTSLKKEKRKKKTKRLIGIMVLLIVLSSAATVFVINVQKKQKDVTLEPAEIEVWIIADKSSATYENYNKVKELFCNEYKKVKVNLKAYPESEYYTKLSEAIDAGKQPDLFMSNNYSESDLEKANNLSSIIYPDDNKLYFLINLLTSNSFNNCYFFDKYQDYFPDAKQIPSSFNVPVLYVNTSLASSFTADEIDSLDDLKEYMNDKTKLVVNSEMQQVFTEIFNKGIGENVIKGNVGQFTSGQAAFYFSDTSEYFECRTVLANEKGNYKVVSINVGKLKCKFNTLWSSMSKNEAKSAAANRLLTFILSDNAQTTVYGNIKSTRALPLNKDSLSRYVSGDGYSELSFIKSNARKFVFEKNNKAA